MRLYIMLSAYIDRTEGEKEKYSPCVRHAILADEAGDLHYRQVIEPPTEGDRINFEGDTLEEITGIQVNTRPVTSEEVRDLTDIYDGRIVDVSVLRCRAEGGCDRSRRRHRRGLGRS